MIIESNGGAVHQRTSIPLIFILLLLLFTALLTTKAHGQKADEEWRKGASYLGLDSDHSVNLKKASHWLHKAAEDGFVSGDNEGWIGYNFIIRGDFTEALFWLHRGADHGDISALVNIGNCYAEGHGVPQNNDEAMLWYTKAANQGNKEAQFILGRSYLNSNQVSQAISWLRLSAAGGDSEAMRLLGDMYRDGKGVPVNATVSQSYYDAANQTVAAGYAERLEQIARDDEASQQRAQAHAAMMNTLTTGLTNLGNQVSNGGADPIQSATNQQMANINSAAARDQQLKMQQVIQHAQQVQAALPQQTVQQRTTTVAALGPRSATVSTSAIASTSTSGPTVNIFCPATGFVPGVMTRSGDTSVGVTCTPGAIIYINGVPQFNTAGTTYSGITASGGVAAGTSTTPPTSNTNNNPHHLITPGAFGNCVTFDFNGKTPLTDGGWDRYTNGCGVPISVTIIFGAGKGGPSRLDLDPGQSAGTANSRADYDAMGGSKSYVCQGGYGAADTDGNYIRVPVSEYVCRQYGW